MSSCSGARSQGQTLDGTLARNHSFRATGPGIGRLRVSATGMAAGSRGADVLSPKGQHGPDGRSTVEQDWVLTWRAVADWVSLWESGSASSRPGRATFTRETVIWAVVRIGPQTLPRFTKPERSCHHGGLIRGRRPRGHEAIPAGHATGQRCGQTLRRQTRQGGQPMPVWPMVRQAGPPGTHSERWPAGRLRA